MTSLTGSDDRGRRRRNRTALVVVAAVGGALLVGMPQAAYAAPVTATVDGIAYEADDADPGAGATITGYTGGATALTIPASVDIAGTSYDVTAIGIGAFANSDLTSVVIPDSVTTMGRDAFIYSDLTDVTLSNSLTTIDIATFAYNNLTTVVIPDSVTTIGASAFDGNGLTDVTLSSSLTTIDAAAFANNDLTSVVIPDSVTTLGNGVFLYNSTLSTVRFEGNAPTISPVGAGQSFGPAAGKSLYFLPGASGFTVPVWEGYTTNVLYTVAFDTGPGSAVGPVDVPGGEQLTAPTDPARAGYDFTGWYTDTAATVAYDFSDPVTSNLTLYAGWRSIPALAPTGFAVGPTAALAGALVLLGGALAIAARRRATR